MEQQSKLSLNIFRAVAVIIVAGGAITTLYLVMQAGANNKSVLLLSLFIVWDLSPFLALLVANSVLKHRNVTVSVTLYVLMLVIAIGSTGYYWHISGRSGPSRTGPFLIVPAISWLLMVIGIPLITAYTRRRRLKMDG